MLKMTSHTIASLPRLSAKTLSEILLSTTTSNLDAQTPPSKIAIIDVRDHDHIGGHIRHSQHYPSATLDAKTPDLVRKLRDKEAVVFHCALSQQRGPSAALRYIRKRERIVGKGSVSVSAGAGSGVGEVLKKNAADKVEEEGKGDEGWEDVDEVREQRVYVLDRGFVGWQELYGEDTRLTEGYRKEIWKDGYWM